jgi:hypothetical protein
VLAPLQRLERAENILPDTVDLEHEVMHVGLAPARTSRVGNRFARCACAGPNRGACELPL